MCSRGHQHPLRLITTLRHEARDDAMAFDAVEAAVASERHKVVDGERPSGIELTVTVPLFV